MQKKLLIGLVCAWLLMTISVRLLAAIPKSPAVTTLFNQYYGLKGKNPVQRELLLNKILQLQPNNRDALLEMGYLLLNEKRLTEALPYFQKASALKPEDYAVTLQIAYLLNELNRNKEAYYQFEKASHSSNKSLKEKSEDAMINLSAARMKVLPEPFFADIYFAPFYMWRYDDNIFPMQIRLGLTYGAEKQGELYTIIYWNEDSQSQIGLAPAIYNDNSITYAVGTRYTPFKQIPIYGYIEIGEAQLLMTQQGQSPWENDLKVGVAGYTDWGAKPTYASDVEYPFTQVGSLYGNVTYYSRYNSDIIGELEAREGTNVFRYHNSSINLYLDGRVFADSRGYYYNNITEFGPGIAFIPNNKYNVAFRVEALEGYYLPVNTSISPNPNTINYYTNVMAEIDIYLRF